MTTEVKDVVARLLTYAESGLASAHKTDCLEIVDLLEAAESRATAAEGRVALLEEALEPFDRLGQIILAEAPPEAQTVVCFTSASGEKFAMQLDYFRAARARLAKGGQ